LERDVLLFFFLLKYGRVGFLFIFKEGFFGLRETVSFNEENVGALMGGKKRSEELDGVF
jgi:hypothetical protein